MGGSTARGNQTPYAEFNVYVDPDAAAEVLASGVPTTWHGLNVTHQALATAGVIDRITALDTPLARTCVELLTFFGATYQRLWGFEGPPLHDPVADAHVIDPTMVTCATVPMRIELRGEWTRGATVIDVDRRTDWTCAAEVGLELDRARFWDLMVGAIDTLDRESAPIGESAGTPSIRQRWTVWSTQRVTSAPSSAALPVPGPRTSGSRI